MAKKAEPTREPTVLNDQEFEQALIDAQTHRADIKTLEDRKSLIDKDIIATMFSRGDVELKNGQGTWKIENKTTRTIDKAALIVAGVDPELIDRCTIETVSSEYLKLYPKREPKEKE